MTSTIILRKKGQFTLPANIRAALNLDENDVLSVTIWNKKAIMIIPQKLETAELLRKTSSLAKKKGVSLEDLLHELEEIRHQA